MAEPKLVKVRTGWMALGNGCGVVGATREEALGLFRDARARHAVILARAVPTGLGQRPWQSPRAAQG